DGLADRLGLGLLDGLPHVRLRLRPEDGDRLRAAEGEVPARLARCLAGILDQNLTPVRGEAVESVLERLPLDGARQSEVPGPLAAPSPRGFTPLQVVVVPGEGQVVVALAPRECGHG